MLHTMPRMTVTGQRIVSPLSDPINRKVTTELYHVRHLCACGANISHSQGAFDAHKFHGGFTDIPVEEKPMPAPVSASFDLDPDTVADVRADLNSDHEDSDGYYTDAQVHAALTKFVQSELETLVEDVGNRFFEQPAHMRERYLGEPVSRKTESRWERADANQD